ncbi:MAG TPA: PQQ-dependent sugar dehydrogenase [Candidatus Binatia bacterium]|nr:PQQ-dependent sugar dehydrogenase [Candidatus Binatia bacterium]
MNTENPGPAPRRGGLIIGMRDWLGRLAARHVILGAAVLLLGGAGAGFLVAKSGVLRDLRTAIIDPMRHAMGERDAARWELYETHLGNFEKLLVSVADRGGGPMAALEELDGHFVFMAQSGHLSTLSPDHALRDLDIDAPMNTDALRAANIQYMDYTHFRALDLLAVPAGEHTFDLYASYDRYHADRRCFDIVVSRIRIETTPGELTPRSGWEEIYATTPCVAPRTAISQFPSAFVGIQSGGRLALRDDHTLLFSIGDLEFDGVMYEGLAEAPNGPQDPEWDMGKVLEIDLRTNRARRFAMGFRNPQGLLIARDGRVWGTEHGPYGGDEINHLRRNGNYGWPNVTYGMRYVPIRENWPLNPTHGGHEGYDRPAYVFVPSIGISQLIQPSVEQFPFWDQVLLITSLRGRALYVARIDGDRVMYAEPLPMGERLRDIINRQNGEIAVLTDMGNLILIRAVHEGATDTISITDARRDRSRTVSPAGEGRRLFAGNCQSCHTVNGQASAGPALNGVVGRNIGSTRFTYSQAMQRAEGNWTEERLVSFLTNPEGGDFQGSTMPPPHLTQDDAHKIVAYLRTTR